MYYIFFSENHILEDVNKCVLALQEGDADTLDRTAGAIRGRSARVCNVVGAEMDNYEPCIYTKRVLEAVKVLRDQGKSFNVCWKSLNILHNHHDVYVSCIQFFSIVVQFSICKRYKPCLHVFLKAFIILAVTSSKMLKKQIY